MARARLIKPGFFVNEDLCDLPAFARLLFAGLWTIADKKGRLDDRPKRIKAELFPYDNVKVPVLLDALEEKGFIKRYRIEDAHLIQIVNWDKHQHPHVKEADSILPGPEWESPSTIPAPDEHGASTGNSGSDPSESDTDPNTDTDAEAENARAPAYPFAIAYVKRWQEEHSGNRPAPSRHGEIVAMEKEHGSDQCFQAAAERGWGKSAGYYREWLLDPNNSKEARNGRAKALVGASGRGARGVVTNDDLDDLERYKRGEID